MKIDWDSVYKDRLVEIDKQLSREIKKQHWGIVNNLRKEKKKLNETIKGMNT